jgi:hypothetical protein
VAEVVSDGSPHTRKGLVQIKIPGLNHETQSQEHYSWARVAGVPFGGSKNKKVGSRAVPYIGSFVYVMFLNGDPDFPIILGQVSGDVEGSNEFLGLQDKKEDINKTINDDLVCDFEKEARTGEYPYQYAIEGVHYSVIYDDTKDAPQIKMMVENVSHLFIREDVVQLSSRNDLNLIARDDMKFYNTNWSTETVETWDLTAKNVNWNVAENINTNSDNVYVVANYVDVQVGSFRMSISLGEANIIGNINVSGGIMVTGDVKAGGGTISLLSHVHSGVKRGGSSTNPPS